MKALPSSRGRIALAAEIAALVGSIAWAWWMGRLATDAWIERAAELAIARTPPADAVRAGSRSAFVCFAAGVLVLAAARIVGALRARDPIRVPLLVPAMVIACGIGLTLHHATVDLARGSGAVLEPSAPAFAQGFLFGSIAAAAILCAPFDLVALAGRLRIPIVIGIAGVFAALAFAGTGPGTSGARINLGPVQPIEAVKPLFVVFLASYLGSRAPELRWQRQRVLALRWPRITLLLPAILALVVILAGLFVVGDLGPVLILALVFLTMFYAVTRASGWVVVSVSIVAALATSITAWPEVVNVGRVATRIRMWRDPWWNLVPHGDQLGESLWAVASGGAWGQGLARAHAPLVPAGMTDLALSTLVEQLGVVVLLVYLAALAAIVASALLVATRTRTADRALLSTGAAALLVAQWAIIHGGTFGTLPLTGIVVPFLSAGRSSMVAFVALVGLVARIAGDGGARTESDELLELRRGALWVGAVALLVFVGGAGASVQVAWVERERTLGMGIATQLADGTLVSRQNPRLVALAARVRRGTISDRNGQPLALSATPVAPRAYPLGASLGTLLGAHPSHVALPPWALEHALDHRLRGYGDRTDGPIGRPWPDLRAFVPLVTLDEAVRSERVRALDANVAARSVRLTLDARLQLAVADLLRRRVASGAGPAAAAVVIAVDSGDVLARAQAPDLDPNDRTWQSQMRARVQPFFGRFTGAYGAWPDKTGTQGVFQSGSVGKLFTALAAARGGLAGFQASCTQRDDRGPFFTRPGWTRPIHDHERDRNHGHVDGVEGLAVSCNVYFGQLALALGPGPFLALRDIGVQVGFGRRFDPGAPGSRQLASTGFGQGALAMTVVQAARVVEAIGSGGRYRRCPATMELAVPCTEIALVDDPTTLAPILLGMRQVMTRGTGRSLQAPDGVRIYGKTGTADVNGFAGEEAFGIARGQPAAPHSWFVALAEPSRTAEGQAIVPGRIAIAVVVPRGGSGASTAGPIAMDIARAAAALGYLGATR
ncbi:MAG: FtsW/RodA/SpoVE family cell cycle protein [Deltaproteobacteria bacterium]|nr:FtsW/RodA/SpoVE family cell cycle protein [Deltaproteobacteria bacterium]